MSAVDPLPNLAAVYGLRQLVSSYAGALVTLRRSTDNTTQSFSPDASGNFPVAAATTFAAGGLLYVTTWFDQSGNGNHAVQATAANQPLLSLSVFDLNSRPAILYGADTARLLTAPAATSINNLFSAGGYISSVVQFEEPVTGNYFILNKGNLMEFGPSLIGPGFSLLAVAAATTGRWSVHSIGAFYNVFDVQYLGTTTARAIFSHDGFTDTNYQISTQPVAPFTSDSASPLQIGNAGTTNGFPGYLAEIIMCRAVPNAALLATLRADQLTYWQKPVANVGLPLDIIGKPVSAVTINNGGAGHAVNDLITLGNGTIIHVMAVTSGAITALNLADGGDWTGHTMTNPVSQVLTTGAGTGSSFNLTLSVPLAAYGNMLLTQNYVANKCLDLTRTSAPATTTLGFVGGVVNQAAGDAFAANDPTSCYVSKWYDQSGNGHDASNATLTNSPAWSATHSIGGIRPTIFNSRQFQVDLAGAFPAIARWLDVPGLNWTPGACTWCFVGQTAATQQQALCENPAGTIQIQNWHTFPGMSESVSAVGEGRMNTSAGATNNPWVMATPAVCVYRWQDSTTTAWSNETTAVGFNAHAPQPAETAARLGTSNVFSGLMYDATAMVLFPRTSMTQARRLVAAMETAGNIVTGQDITLWVEADSLSMSRGSLMNNTQYSLALPAMRAPVRMYNNAISGYRMYEVLGNYATVASAAAAGNNEIQLNVGSTSAMSTGDTVVVTGTNAANGTWTIQVISSAVIQLTGSTFSAAENFGFVIDISIAPFTGTILFGGIGAFYPPTTTSKFIILLEIGFNDLRDGIPVPYLQQEIMLYLNYVRSLGANIQVLISTVPLQLDFQNIPARNAQAQIMNPWFKSLVGTPPVGGVIDYFSDPIVGANNYTVSPYGDPTLSRDGEHPTDKNLALLAPYVSGAVNLLLFPPPPIPPPVTVSLGGSSGLAYGQTYDRKVDEEDEEALLVLLH